jgi:hypothetical protein
MMEAKTVSETLGCDSILARMMARECFIAFSRRESFEYYTVDLVQNRFQVHFLLYFTFLALLSRSQSIFSVNLGLYIYKVYQTCVVKI